jgi:hypothetical protein
MPARIDTRKHKNTNTQTPSSRVASAAQPKEKLARIAQPKMSERRSISSAIKMVLMFITVRVKPRPGARIENDAGRPTLRVIKGGLSRRYS